MAVLYAIYPYGPAAVLIKNPDHVQPQPYGFKQHRVMYGPIQEGVGTVCICFPPNDELRWLIPQWTKVTDILNGVTGDPFVDMDEWNDFIADYGTLGVNENVYALPEFTTAGAASTYEFPELLDAELIQVLGLPDNFDIGTEVTLANNVGGDAGELTFTPVPPDGIPINILYKKPV